ncbi:VOC family protein [Roseateles sp. LKC17W]|uniref:VOC family protein n=1 Tax=Pelomonas margarita TaxID=3299031 RepID=A0ABW7FGX8_9BURK
MTHALNWFEIPVTDYARAKGFYEQVLGITITTLPMGPVTMGMLSTDPQAVGGALVHGDGSTPSATGTLVYLNGGDDLAPLLARVEAAGGRVLVPKTEIGNDFGFFAHFLDTEGNKLGLHSMG